MFTKMLVLAHNFVFELIKWVCSENGWNIYVNDVLGNVHQDVRPTFGFLWGMFFLEGKLSHTGHVVVLDLREGLGHVSLLKLHIPEEKKETSQEGEAQDTHTLKQTKQIKKLSWFWKEFSFLITSKACHFIVTKMSKEFPKLKVHKFQLRHECWCKATYENFLTR